MRFTFFQVCNNTCMPICMVFGPYNCSFCPYWPWRDPFWMQFQCKIWGAKSTVLMLWKMHSKVQLKLVWGYLLKLQSSVQTEISQQLLDRLTWLFVHLSMVPREQILTWWSPNFSFSASSRSKFSLIPTCAIWIGARICTDIHSSQMVYTNDLCDPLTFPLVPPVGLYLSFEWNVSTTTNELPWIFEF